MQYSNEFKEKCSQAFMGTSSLPNLIKACEQKNDILVRWCLEDGLDDQDQRVELDARTVRQLRGYLQRPVGRSDAEAPDDPHASPWY